MKLDKPLVLVLCALFAVVCGCGTEEPEASQATTDVVAVELEEFTNSIGMKFKLIPAGEFMMGRPEDAEDPNWGEFPVHQVRITRPYYLGATEVTQGQWEEVMGNRPWEAGEYAKSGLEYPASFVSWDDAVEFCRKLSEREGRAYRLPTEAEWEYACRAGSTTQFGFGDDASRLGAYGWYIKSAGGWPPQHRVSLKRANAWGLYDMHGNVNEWCQDRYEVDYFTYSPVDDPTGPQTVSRIVMRGGHWVEDEEWHRVVRGGTWGRNAEDCRSASRGGCGPDYRNDERGFRVALDPAAIADYTEAIRLNPEYAEAYYERGKAYYRIGEYDKALTDFTEAIQLDTEYAEAHNGRGIVHANNGNYDNAIADFSKVIRLDPGDSEAYRSRGDAYTQKGNYDKAKTDFAKAWELGRDSE